MSDFFNFPSPQHYNEQNINEEDMNGPWIFPGSAHPPVSSQSSHPRSLASSHSPVFRTPPHPQASSSWQVPHHYGGQQPPFFPVPQHQSDFIPSPPADVPFPSYTLARGGDYHPMIPSPSSNSFPYGHSESFPNPSQNHFPAYSSYSPLVSHLPDARPAQPAQTWGNNYPQPHQQWTPQLSYQNNTRTQSTHPIQRSTPQAYHRQTNLINSFPNTVMNESSSEPTSAQWPTMLAPNYNLSPYPRRPGRKRGLCVGINYEGQDTSRVLRGAVNDAMAVRDFLIDHGGYNSSDIVVLHDRSNNRDTLPTLENIIAHMKDLTRNAQSNDSLFFHFSGHGGLTKDLNGDERPTFDFRKMTFTAMDSVIYTVDGKEIIDDEMHDILVKPLPKGCRLTALFDACHSGTALDLPFVYKPQGGLSLPSLFSNLRRSQKKSSADVVSWSSCRDRESSADTWAGNTPVGAMSNAFINSLKKNPNQTYQQLLFSVRSRLHGRDRQIPQHPQLGSSHKIDTNQPFLF